MQESKRASFSAECAPNPEGTKKDASGAAAPRLSEEAQRDLRYLREQRICETLEAALKHLLRERPADPTMAICTYLRAHGAASGIFPAAASTQTLDTEGETGSSAHGEGVKLGQSVFPIPEGPRPALRIGSAPSQHTVGTPTGTSPASGSGLQSFGRPTSSDTKIPKRGRVTPSHAIGLPRGGVQLRGSLEREESAKSDVSAFSISSVDMSEFLAEFCAARLGLVGDTGGLMTRSELAAIVDRVALPLPDLRLLADLFNEIDADCTGEIKFETFLARMNFKIQGRFHPDVIRGVFCSMLSSQLSPRRTAVLEVPSNPYSLHTFASGKTQTAPSIATTKALAGAADSAECVTKTQCLEEGIRGGLGLYVTAEQFAQVVTSLGIPAREDFEFDLTDFSRVAMAVAGQQEDNFCADD